MSDNTLAFLDLIVGSRKYYYAGSKWLDSEFTSNIWSFKFENDNDFNIDWGVTLSNGTLLTDSQNTGILNTFKYWVNAVTHPDNTRGRGANYADGTAKNQIIWTLTVIDYLLLNDSHLDISTCGLQAITEDHLKHFIDRLTSLSKKAESVYAWNASLRDYLMREVAEYDKNELLSYIENSDIEFDEITDSQIEGDKLGIPHDIIPLVRCWLWLNGFYWKARVQQYGYNIRTLSLSDRVYGKTTLRGAAGSKPVPAILCLEEKGNFRREYDMAPVRVEDEDAISKVVFRGYKRVINALLLLRDEAFADEGLMLPSHEAVYAIKEYQPNRIRDSRFVSLPTKVVLDSVKDAIEFHVNYAGPLIWSFDNLLVKLKEMTDVPTNRRGEELKRVNKFVKLLHPDIRALGVKEWSIGWAEKDKHIKLRANKSLGGLIKVYYGCVELVVGALMARRQVELISLDANNCLDKTGKYLIFGKAKSTTQIEGHRVVVARPIDDIAAEMMGVLISYQEVFLKHGLIEKKGCPFDTVNLVTPDKPVLLESYRHAYNDNLDYFCDYFETPLIDGKRHYIRTHQLRRFFALSFFWGGGFGGMDTLRWFMGHTDPEHLYRYITENSPGEVLRHAKSQFVSETIEEHEELMSLVKEKYGTEDFTLLNTCELELFIDELLEEGVVEVEPDFIHDAEGTSYRIAVTVKGVAA